MKKIKPIDSIKKMKNKIKNKVDNEIKQKGLKNFIWSVILSLLIFFASAVLVFVLYIIISAPNFDKNKLYKKEATVLYDKNGIEFARVGQENRQLIEYDDLPQVYVDALIATEDSRFFQHNGLDIARFLKASLGQLTSSNAGGASTITMQLIKKTYTNDEAHGIAGIIRKFTDIYMAVFKLESCYTKEEILEFYSNSLWFGNSDDLNYSGIYGVEQASQYFFGKSVTELNLSEASLLVGMYQNPYYLNPFRYPEASRKRQKTVLTLMVNHGYITNAEKDAALEIPVESMLADHSEGFSSSKYQAIIDYVIDEIEEETGRNPRKEAMKIYTTYDLKVQDVLVQLENEEFYKFKDEYVQEGIAITSEENGSIVALSGGRNYQARGTNRAVDINRQPGSTAKPLFDYAPYIEYLNASTGTYFFDDRYTYKNGTKISNADNSYMGLITMRTALLNSRNVPALQAFQYVANDDISHISNLVHGVGIDYGQDLYESASIGGFNGTNPLEMSAAYSIFGRSGYYIKPYAFTKIIYEDNTTYEHKYIKEKIISEETAYMITSILMDALTSNWCGQIRVSGTNIGCKTGTTNIDAKTQSDLNLPDGFVPDIWSITYSPEYSIALWYGYDKHSSEYFLRSNDGGLARSAIMSQLAKRIYSTNKTFKKPSGVVSVKVEKETIPLALPSEYTPADMIITELFKEGTEPVEVSNRYAKLDPPTGGKATYNGNEVTITWNKIATPSAIDTAYLQNYFNENYKTITTSFASKYYENRIKYNDSNIGNIGYQVFMQAEDGTLNDLTWTAGNTYTQTLEGGKTYKFVIKSAYSIFKNNMSDGLTINVTTKADTTVENSITPNVNNETVKPNPLPGTTNSDTGLD